MSFHPLQTDLHFAAGPANVPAVILVHGSVVSLKMWLHRSKAYNQAVCAFAQAIGWAAVAGAPARG